MQHTLRLQPSAKERLAVFLESANLDDLDRLIRRLGRAPRTSSSTVVIKIKEGPTLSKYMSHKEFKVSIAAKLDELAALHGPTIFRRSGALRKGEPRNEYVRWYLNERRSHIASHEKQFDQPYYERQALALARIVNQERNR